MHITTMVIMDFERIEIEAAARTRYPPTSARLPLAPLGPDSASLKPQAEWVGVKFEGRVQAAGWKVWCYHLRS